MGWGAPQGSDGLEIAVAWSAVDESAALAGNVEMGLNSSSGVSSDGDDIEGALDLT